MLEKAYKLMMGYYVNLSRNPSRQNKRRIDREFIKDCKRLNVNPADVIKYAQNKQNGDLPEEH